MKYFDNIINNMVSKHKNPSTQYSETQMFVSKNELSIAISRLMDAQRIFADDFYDNDNFTSQMSTKWYKLKDDIPSQTAIDLALCIIQNTPFSSSSETINEVQKTFYKAIYAYTNNKELSNAFTQIFFGEAPSKMPKMKDH